MLPRLGPHRGRERLERNAQALVNRGQDPRLHLGCQVPVDGTDGAPTGLPAACSGGPVAHQLIGHPDRDAGILQPGREGVPQVVWRLASRSAMAPEA
jgi:hypothetical protein